MLIKGNNGKSPARKRQSVAASSSSVKSRSNHLQKSNSSCNDIQAAAKLDANSIHPPCGIVEGETSNPILEETGTAEGTRGIDLPNQPTELTAITLIQPWASLIANGHKQYETRDWSTSYRGPIAIHAGRKPKGKQELREHDKVVTSFDDLLTEECPYSSVIAIAQMTDCILMTEEFISQQTETELRCGNWQVGRYAFKLENVRPIAPIEAAGKQGLWKWNSDTWNPNELKAKLGDRLINGTEFATISIISGKDVYLKRESGGSICLPASELKSFGWELSSNWNPDDFGEVQHKAEPNGQLNLLEWEGSEPPDPDDYVGPIKQFEAAYKAWVNAQTDEAEEELANFGEQELCDILMDGSTFVQESEPASPMPESNCGNEALTTSASGTVTAAESLQEDSPESTESTTSESVTLNSTAPYSSSLLARLVNPSQLMETDLEPTTPETVSPTCLEQSEHSSPTSQLLKTSQDFSTVPIPPATNQEVTSATSSTPYPRSGSMQNGKLSAAPTLGVSGEGNDSLLLRSPGGLSSGENSRPPGKSRLETQLNQLGLIQDGEVAAPEFLELGYQLPIGYTNLQESRTALELSQTQSQQLSIDPKSELPQETETTETDEKPSETPLTGGLLVLDCAESNISLTLPPNIGALGKAELISLAREQHEIISLIERKQFELAVEKIHRVRITGEYLIEFKKRCQYGEFLETLESYGIGSRSAQEYMMVAKNWETIETKARAVALLPEENRPTLGIKWALESIREEKKQLKKEAPPKDPDNWRTPNTSDQPIVSLVRKALGGDIWLDPCSNSGSSSTIPAAVRYYKNDDGLAEHNGWSKTVFINPPFSDPFPWVERCCLEFARGNVSAAIMLLKAGVVSNVGTGELINKYASAICHWRGRINFLNDEGNPIKGSDFDCVFVYFGARLDLFRQSFGGRGTIATIENHYSSVNKKYLLTNEIPEFGNTQAEQKQLAAAVGLGNGRSVLPDMRDADRELMERYDPHTVLDVMSVPTPTPTMPPTIPAPPISKNLVQPLGEQEVFDETPLAERQFETAKENCLNDYITAISSNLSDFSNEQISFLAKIINEESAKRIGF